MDASVPIISLSFRQTTLRQACNNVRCSLPRQTGNAFPAGNGIKHKTRKATSKSSCCRLSYSGTASYIFPAVFCGKRGIRTPGALQLNGFQDRRNRPLCHLCGHKSITSFRLIQTGGRTVQHRSAAIPTGYLPTMPLRPPHSPAPSYGMSTVCICGRRRRHSPSLNTARRNDKVWIWRLFLVILWNGQQRAPCPPNHPYHHRKTDLK